MESDTTHVVLNCAVTQILGYYATEKEATAAAGHFGNCSFAHQLTDTERAALAAQHQQPGDKP